MATTTTKRAEKGGQFGANGEWYEGGKFINTTPDNAKGTPKKAKPRKVQVKPYVWVVDDRTPIFRLVGAAAAYDHAAKRMRPYTPAFLPNGEPRPGVGNTNFAETATYCDRFNAGERWM